MAQGMTKDEIAKVIHGEVAEYMDREFTDDEHFVSDLKLLSDDLTAIALDLERHFRIRIERRRYRDVSNVNELAELMADAIRTKERA